MTRLARSLQSNLGKGRQNEAGLMDIRVVVPAELELLLAGERAQRLLDVAAGILAADHEANLTAGVSRDGGISPLSDGENLFAVLLELGNQRHVEPLVLGCEVTQN